MSYEDSLNFEANAVQRVVHLPLVRSVAQSVASVYTSAKGRYPFLGLVGGVTELGVRNLSQAALDRATPLLESLEPQIEAVNAYACVGLDQLEKSFPVLQQSSEEVVDHLKDAFFLTLDDMQLSANDVLDEVLLRGEQLVDTILASVALLQDSQLGRVANAGMDEILTHLEEATAYYLPIPPTLRLEWERRIQQFEDEDEDEPGIWTRFRCLMLSLSMQFYHRLLKLRERLDQATRMLGDAADKVGLGRVLALMGLVLQRLQLLFMATVYRVEGLRDQALGQIRSQAQALVKLGPVQQAMELPAQIQLLLGEVQEFGMVLVQLLVNSTPLYNLLEKPSDQEVEDFLNREEFRSDNSSRRSSVNSLFLKAMDGRPRRRKSLYTRPRRGSATGTTNPQASGPGPVSPGNNKELDLAATPSSDPNHRRSSASKLLLGPIIQLMSQGQKALEYLSPEPATPEVETTYTTNPQDPSLAPVSPANSKEPPVKLDIPATSSSDAIRRRSSAYNLLLGPIMQMLSQDKEVLENVSPEPVTPVVDITDKTNPQAPASSPVSSANSKEPPLEQDIPAPTSSNAIRRRSSALGRRASGHLSPEALTPVGKTTDTSPANSEEPPVKLDIPATSSSDTIRRRSSAYKLLIGPIMQLLSQDQEVLEYASPELVSPDMETTESPVEIDIQAMSSSDNIRRRSSASGKEVLRYVSPEPVTPEEETTEPPIELEVPAMRSSDAIRRRSSAYKLLLGPIMQILSQGQETVEHLSPEPVSPMEEATDTTDPQAPVSPANSEKSTLELDEPTPPFATALRRHSSASELLLGPIMQIVSLGQEALEFLSTEPVDPEEEESTGTTNPEDPSHTPISPSNSKEPPSELDIPSMRSSDAIRRRASASMLLLGPIMQIVSQGQEALEFLSSEPVVETGEQ